MKLNATHGNIIDVARRNFKQEMCECIAWSNEREYSDNPFDPQQIAALEAIADEFMDIHAAELGNTELYLPEAYNQAGHDFALTCEGHGTGFWDRPEIYGQKAADDMTATCERVYLETHANEDDCEYAIEVMCGYYGDVKSLADATRAAIAETLEE